MYSEDRDSKGRYIKGWRVPLQPVSCKQCGKQFQVLPHEVKERVYCSRRCRANSLIGKPSPRTGKFLPDDKKVWTTARKNSLLSLWEFASKDEILATFPGKRWETIKDQIQYMKVKDGANVPPRRRSNTWLNKDDIFQSYCDGEGTHEIARRYRTSHTQILRMLRKRGIQRRSNAEAQRLAMTPERKIKQSKALTEYLIKHPELKTRLVTGLIGWHTKHPEFRSKKMRAWLADSKNYAEFCKNMKAIHARPEWREGQRTRRALQKFPLFDAKTTEIPIQHELKRRGIPFSSSYPTFSINKKPIRLVDIAFPNEKVAVECDGDYWHGNPAKFKNLNEMQIKRQQIDAEQDRKIREVGWVILRIWETDIRKDVKACVDKIEEAVRKCRCQRS